MGHPPPLTPPPSASSPPLLQVKCPPEQTPRCTQVKEGSRVHLPATDRYEQVTLFGLVRPVITSDNTILFVPRLTNWIPLWRCISADPRRLLVIDGGNNCGHHFTWDFTWLAGLYKLSQTRRSVYFSNGALPIQHAQSIY